MASSSTGSSISTAQSIASTHVTTSHTIITPTTAITTTTPEDSNTTAPPPAALTTAAVVGIASGAGVIAVVGTGLLFGGQIIKLFW